MEHAYQKLGRYVIIREIASGGMATVYKGKLLGIEGFEKDVAIKKILPYWADKQEFVDMLIDEAKILVHLNHQNIVQIFELAKENKSYFIAMEFVDGFDLRSITSKLSQQKHQLSFGLICYIIKEICKGLEFAHGCKDPLGNPLNIIHRDISPQNILISREGEVKITDFGIAKIIGKSSTTNTGMLKGKFSYMSPEQALGQKLDQRSDLFSLGSLLYELASLKKCFDGDNDLETIEQVKAANIDLSGDIPTALQKILTKALQKDSYKRYQTVAAFKKDIITFEKTLEVTASTDECKQLLIELFGHKENHETSLPQKDLSHLQTCISEQQNQKGTVTLASAETKIQSITIKEPQKAIPTTKSKTLWKDREAFIGIFLVLCVGFYTLLSLKPGNTSVPQTQKTQTTKLATKAPITKNTQQLAPPKTIETTTPVGALAVHPQNKKTTEKEPKLAQETPKQIAPALPKTGTIKIISHPWTYVSIGNSGRKNTPHEFELTAGEHNITVRHPLSGAYFTKNVVVEENETKNCVAHFKKYKRGRLDCQDIQP